MSISSQGSCSTSSSYPMPKTPEQTYRSLPDFSPSTFSPKTPETLRSYSSALKAQMAAGLSNAMKELKDDRGGPERAFDVEYGYDEDPIERHVRLYLSPKKKENLSGLSSEMEGRLEVIYDTPESTSEAPFRPGLINFHRSFPSTAPSLSRTGSSSSRTDGERTRSSGSDTPGSILSYTSESSFEALAPDNYHSPVEDVFGDSDFSRRLSLDESEAECSKRASSISNADSIMTIVPDHSTPKSKIRVRTSLFKPVCPATEPPKSSIPSKERRSIFSRPSLLRPRNRTKPVTVLSPPVVLNSEVDGRIGMAYGGEDEEEDWLEGRTISETMIAVAGLQCQRGRGLGTGARS